MPPPTLLQLLKERPLKHPVVRDNQFGEVIRQGVQLPRDPFHRHYDPTLKNKPEKLPGEVIQPQSRAAVFNHPQQVLGVHLKHHKLRLTQMNHCL